MPEQHPDGPNPAVALATATDVWDEDVDAAPLTEALGRAGIAARPVVWDDPSADWAAFDLVLVRSTWDYVGRRDEFLAWAEDVERRTRLANPAGVLRWNTDKRYLAELDAAGVPVVPTAFLAPGDDTAAVRRVVAGAADGTDVVVKPTVSAGSKDTSRYTADDLGAAVDHAAALLTAGRDVMVQPYLDAVDTDGETGVVVLDGVPSHAFRKSALLRVGAGPVDGLFAPEEIGPATADASHLAVVDAVMAVVSERFTDRPVRYARVDMVRGSDGAPRLLELELTEPSLFLWTDPTSADRVATAVRRWCRD